MDLKNISSVYFFGALGGSCRYYLGLKFPGISTTLLINLVGCFALSFLTYYVIEQGLLSGWLNLGLGTGFIGAFTTFSSFCNDFDQSLIDRHFVSGSLYLVISIIGGYLMALTAFNLAKKLAKRKERS